ncbi:bifunctional 2',3'-cyclic-nucleotide 2'-phosphodiesterase/3'-nucleotidase [Paracoccus spongiarum]|uniref:Bifunctional 2',3'-cyclic-nucleotide 2'-phosphodiesterase/3'-nucleotidase n=1 Tax=Paracoccus spongiarum TaxID=3064387 RepID=A0ABT9JBL5_9RHOB|nr:bifunctional 2',3'-cyclic-nucleotide 2'-phosphodiesterase/3'-nucleotidase [Paracoccus sp. 2205BS29-5]MDP5307224.1 bifunctional 2',3'-cyclic-nucleotide 2'-phosphodiesterase/3'-nucleotidase [Paracoccus sp. 2205BS29-5]
MPDGRGDTSTCAAMAAGHDTGLGLRILATTDMHMNVLPYNYFTGRPCDRVGLARTASLVEIRRAEVRNALLLDNGDFLQGTPLGDLAAAGIGRELRRIHPAIAAMNAMGYDAAALGNHDFNFGLSFLRAVTARAGFPFLAANLRVRRGPSFRRHVILRREMIDWHGRRVEVAVGIVGFLPPRTAEWDRDLSDQLACDDILETARRVIPEMRAEGAQIVIALAHSGIGRAEPRPGLENAAAALAAIPGIDAVVAGHTHEVFPGPDFPAAPGIDPVAGTLAGKPAVMPGFGGSHLGVIDLQLRPDGAGGWRVAAASARAESVDAALPSLAQVARPVLGAHRETLRHLRRRVGRSATALNSYFSVIGDDPGLRLVNMAQRWHVRQRLKGSPWEGYPVLSASAPFRAGGRGGPQHYTDVPPGPLSLRNLADLYFFPNRICAIRLSGAQLADWLERSASLFRRVAPGSTDSPLIDPAFPCYNFDVVDGITWQVDLSAPARFAPDGRLLAPQSRRIRELRWQGRPVGAEDIFVLATNSYRLAGCGLFSPLVADNELALKTDDLTRDVLRHYIRRRRSVAIDAPPHWRFVPMPGTSALFNSGPGGLAHLDRVAERHKARIEYDGAAEGGFARFRLFL